MTQASLVGGPRRCAAATALGVAAGDRSTGRSAPHVAPADHFASHHPHFTR